MSTEIRTIPTKIELRKVGGKNSIRGFAARYGTMSSNLGGFRERIAHGAFAGPVKRGDDVRMCFNHDPNQVLGRTKSRTLRIMEMCSGGAHEACGLWFECDLPDTQLARDLRTSIERGDIDGCSFAFQVPDGGDQWDEGVDENGIRYPRRTLTQINPLVDVSCVTYPAYPDGTSVSAADAPPALKKMLNGRLFSQSPRLARGSFAWRLRPQAQARRVGCSCG